MFRVVFAGLTLLGIAGAACATCAIRARVVAPVYSAAVYAAPVVVEKVVVEKIVAPVATYVPIPVYSAVYTPPPTMPPAELRKDDVRQILEALQALDARLKALERPTTPVAPAHPTPEPLPTPTPVPPPVKPVDPFVPKKEKGSIEAPKAPPTGPKKTSLIETAKPHAALAVFQAKCAGCHNEKDAAEKGGGFTLVHENNLAPLTDRQSRRVTTLTYTGRMPPKKTGVTLTDQEVSLIIDAMDQLK